MGEFAYRNALNREHRRRGTGQPPVSQWLGVVHKSHKNEAGNGHSLFELCCRRLEA